MLSENQRELISLKVNETTDIPFLNESAEDRIIDKVLERLNPYLEPSLRALCPDPYVNCLKIALQEDISSEEKRHQIGSILHPTLAEPLSKKMAGLVDISLVPESMEEQILSVVCRKIVDEFVEWTVGTINERFEQRLENTREFAANDPSLPDPINPPSEEPEAEE